MKIYKRFKGMSKSAKVGLVGSAVYAAGAFALPAFADTVEEPVQPVFQPVDVSQVTTVEQAETIYQEKIAEYSIDKKIESKEITELVKVKDLEASLVKAKITHLEKEGVESRQKVEELDENIAFYKEKGRTLDDRLKHPDVKKILEKNFERLEKEVLLYYPGFIKRGDSAITYPSDTKLDSNTRKPFKEIVKETNNTLKDYYDDKSLEPLVDSYTLREVFVFYNLLSKKIATIQEDLKLHEATLKAVTLEKQNFTDKIKSLEAEKSLILDSEHVKQLEANLKPLQEKLEQVEGSYALLKTYSDLSQEIASYKSEHRDFSRFLYISGAEWVLSYGEDYLSEMRDKFKGKDKVSSNLESYFKDQGFDVSLVDKLHNPANTKWPSGLGILLGLIGPIFRNLAILKYLGGGRTLTGRDNDTAATLGLLEGVFGALILDSIHPLVFPIRMIGVPVVWHGILRLTGGDKGVYDYASK